jgi:hypothetical protein
MARPLLRLPLLVAILVSAAPALAADAPPPAAPAPAYAPLAPAGTYPPGAYPQPAYYPQAAPYPQQPWNGYAPSWEPAVRPRAERRSGGAMAAGIVLLSLGVTTAIGSAPFLHDGAQTCAVNGEGFTCNTPGPGAGFIAMLVGGIVGVVAGVPLIVYGAGTAPPPQANGGTGSGPLPRWAGAPGATGWRWTF